MRRSDFILATLVVADLLAVTAWFKIAPSSPMIAAVGLAGPRVDTDRTCSAWYRQDAWIRLPSRTVTCFGPFDSAHPEDRHQISYDQLTRRVEYVRTTVAAQDSMTWSSRQDSIARTIARRGGREILCPPASRAPTHVKSERHWRFDGFDVRLLAYRFEEHDPRFAEWLLQLDAFAPRAPGCQVVAGLA